MGSPYVDRSAPARKVWRCSKRALFWARLGLPVFCTAGAASLVAGMVGAIELEPGLTFGVMLLLFGAALQRFTLYPSLEATPHGLIVRNPLSTKTVAWESVEAISPGYSGLEIAVRGGRPVTVWCVQKNNWDTARGTRTRSDEVVDEIAAYASGV